MKQMKRQLAQFSAGSGLVLAANASHAAVPAEATTAFTDLLADATSILALGWPVLAFIVTGFIMMKLFKKIANKAT
jgi:hypothetical protein